MFHLNDIVQKKILFILLLIFFIKNVKQELLIPETIGYEHEKENTTDTKSQSQLQSQQIQQSYNPNVENIFGINGGGAAATDDQFQQQQQTNINIGDNTGGGNVGTGIDPNQFNFNTDFNYNFNTGFGQGGTGIISGLNGVDGIDQNSFCPEFWIAYRNVCYRFIKSPKRNWHEAKKICKAYKAELLNVDTLEKHSFVLKQLILQNQKQNRYFISAKQLGPNSWTNDNNTPLLHVDDSFSYDLSDLNQDIIEDNLQDLLLQYNNQYYNQFDQHLGNNQFLQSAAGILPSSSVSPNVQQTTGTNIGGGGIGTSGINVNIGNGGVGNIGSIGGTSQRINPLLNPNYNPNLPGGGGSGRFNTNFNTNYQLNIDRTRLVYAYSRVRDRWMFIPSYEFEQNLFICESYQLYDPQNINILQDDKRKYDYGIIINDFKKIPRGPYFMKQPVDVTFDTSIRKILNDVTLTCLAGGYPTPEYFWYKEEYVNDNLTYRLIDPILNQRYTISGGNLIIYNPEQNIDQGTYHCIAENKFGRIRSEKVQLNFGFIMEFNLKRSPESGDSNWGKSIFCDPPQHYPGVKYYWSREYFPNFVDEDQRVFVSHDGALYFSALEIIDRGNYSCTVQSLISSTGRNGPFFPLRVRPHPNYQALIFANSFPKVFPEAPIANEEIRLECIAFGYPVPSYNWTRKNYGLPKQSYQMNYNRVLIIPNATLNDNGEYMCTIRNDRKTLQKSIVISIQMKPNFTIPLRDKVKDQNSEVNFICEANAIPDVNYTWYKNAEKLDKNQLDENDKFVIQDNVLTIKYLDSDKDNGMYQCGAENQLKQVYSSGQLRVLSMKPSFQKHPLESEIYAIYNGNTTIVCNPEAAPRPKFQWKKDGNIIGAGGHRRILPTGTLIISPTSRDDEGIYTCVATNTHGSDESRSRLIVLQELRFTQSLEPRVITHIHEYVYLHCDVIYDELLDVAFVWKHNGQILQPKLIQLTPEEQQKQQSLQFQYQYQQQQQQLQYEYQQLWIETEHNPRIRINYNSLEIHNITLLDGGEYECVAKSAVNQISTKSYIYVQGPPDSPGGVKVIEIHRTTARLEWIDGSDNGRQVMYYNILGRTTYNKTWVNVTEGVLAYEVDRYTGRKQAEIGNLTPWSGYEFSVCAVNDLGIGKKSMPSPLYNTHTDKPYIAPYNVSGGGGKIGNLVIKWTPLKPSEQNANDLHYKIFWKLHINDSEWATQILKEQGNDGEAVVHIPFDNYYTKYDVKVQAINAIGMGPESNVSVIYSAEDMPQVAPQLPIAAGYNSTALNVSWNPVEITREKIRGRLIGHRLKYWKKGYREEDSIYYLSRTTRPWALIVGLSPDTYYFVKVMAYNAAGEGPESERYLERTYRKAPQKPPSSTQIYKVDPSTVRVTWRYVGVSQEEEPILGYKVRVWEADQDMSRANDTIVEIEHKLECYVGNLTPGKAYKMRILAFSNGGDGRMSSPELEFQMGRTIRSAASHFNFHLVIHLNIFFIFFYYIFN